MGRIQILFTEFRIYYGPFFIMGPYWNVTDIKIQTVNKT